MQSTADWSNLEFISSPLAALIPVNKDVWQFHPVPLAASFSAPAAGARSRRRLPPPPSVRFCFLNIHRCRRIRQSRRLGRFHSNQNSVGGLWNRSVSRLNCLTNPRGWYWWLSPKQQLRLKIKLADSRNLWGISFHLPVREKYIDSLRGKKNV